VLLERVQQRDRLQPVARGARALLLDHATPVDRLLHARHDQVRADLRDHPIAVVDHLGEVVPRVHVHHGEREPAGMERLAGKMQQDG
jgi:hypothetical protein